ncbi:YobA family protein [Cohnella silvisoli]|uniref:YobA family protein n=1 Tax=Cohnella silvisoli TaxID=2873699 RepID=A0ABV1L357_9BACL|nr:YobA family protein [Cohnella silvisoli]MCD9025918.1 YobA family protein [Cohnella silvisoli]
MRKYKMSIMMISLFMILAACGNKPEREPQAVKTAEAHNSGFNGYVVKKEKNRILVVNSTERDFGANGGASHYYEAIWFSNSPFNIEVGQHVEVRADGAIAESYPAQGKANTVAVITGLEPEGASLSEAEAVRKALSSPEVSGYDIPAIKEVKFDEKLAEWIVEVTQNGDEKTVEIRVKDNQVASQEGRELGATPPQPLIKAGEKKLAVYQSSYCWGTGCADYVGPEEMLKEKPKEQVEPGATITFAFENVKQPTEIYVSRSASRAVTQEKLDGSSFAAPKEKGIYYYSLSAWWMKDKEKRISEGDSSYVFAIEVVGE